MIPPTFTEETKREFDEADSKGYFDWPKHPSWERAAILGFIEARTQAAYELGDKHGYERGIVEESQNCWEHSEKAKAEGRAETLKEVREMCQEMSKDFKGYKRSSNEAFARGEVLSDLITRLTQ